jgi:hypothetical protein
MCIVTGQAGQLVPVRLELVFGQRLKAHALWHNKGTTLIVRLRH